MGKHADTPSGLVGEELNKIKPLLNRAFLVRLGEQSGVAFAAAFVGLLTATSGSLTTDVLSAALAAGLRAVYGVIVKDSGDTLNTPQVK